MNRARYLLAAAMLVIRRSAIAYPIYLLAPILTIDFAGSSVTAYVVALLALGFAAFSYTLSAASGQTSATAVLLELALLTPLLLFASGFRLRGEKTPAVAISALRLINVLIFAFSMLHLYHLGFPYKLPYRNYLPDEYFAAYGIGGARIATMFGFLGVVTEMRARSLRSHGVSPSRIGMGIAVVNFLIPSYIIGIAAGLFAIILSSLLGTFRSKGSPRVLAAAVVLVIVAYPAISYAQSRLSTLNSTVNRVYGQSPKVLAHRIVITLYKQNPMLAMSGVGPGQFTSSPQAWASDAVQVRSKQRAPHVPGLRSTSYYQNYVEPIDALAFTNVYATSSAANEPNTGITTLYAEWGFVGATLLLMLLWRRFRIMGGVDASLAAVGIFCLALNAVDNWLDDPWLWAGVILIAATVGPMTKRAPAVASDESEPAIEAVPALPGARR